MKKLHRILPLALVLIVFSCQPKTFMNIEEIPTPPEARAGSIEGRYEVELDAAINTILTDLKKSYSKTEERILFLPPETEAARVFEFYAPKLTAKGFAKDAGVPPQRRNFQHEVWVKGGEAISIAVVDAGADAAGKPIKFLAIHTGEK
ncbi:MAG TPA: hypothetical protein VIL74_21105 [Pyrinomonadaceae bacterium]|jgi:hypothetical protein